MTCLHGSLNRHVREKLLHVDNANPVQHKTDRVYVLSSEDLARTGGAWLLMTNRNICAVIETRSDDVLTGIEANGDCWFEWITKTDEH